MLVCLSITAELLFLREIKSTSRLVAEYSRILSFQCTQRFTILRKTRSKIFFGTKRPEMVYSGANLLSELKSEIKIFPDADCLLP